MLTIAEWRKRILIHLSSAAAQKFCSEQSFREMFGLYVDANLHLALESLVKDKLIFNYGDTGYTLNPTPAKAFEIIKIIMEDLSLEPQLTLEHDGEFADCEYWFGNNGTDKNKSNYLYYRSKLNSQCFKVKIAKQGRKSARLDLGCLDNPTSKIGMILVAIKSNQKSPFTKSDIEKTVHHKAGNNRQPIKAAFDILEALGMLVKVNPTAKNTQYVKLI